MLDSLGRGTDFRDVRLGWGRGSLHSSTFPVRAGCGSTGQGPGSAQTWGRFQLCPRSSALPGSRGQVQIPFWHCLWDQLRRGVYSAWHTGRQLCTGTLTHSSGLPPVYAFHTLCYLFVAFLPHVSVPTWLCSGCLPCLEVLSQVSVTLPIGSQGSNLKELLLRSPYCPLCVHPCLSTVPHTHLLLESFPPLHRGREAALMWASPGLCSQLKSSRRFSFLTLSFSPGAWQWRYMEGGCLPLTLALPCTGHLHLHEGRLPQHVWKGGLQAVRG